MDQPNDDLLDELFGTQGPVALAQLWNNRQQIQSDQPIVQPLPHQPSSTLSPPTYQPSIPPPTYQPSIPSSTYQPSIPVQTYQPPPKYLEPTLAHSIGATQPFTPIQSNAHMSTPYSQESWHPAPGAYNNIVPQNPVSYQTSPVDSESVQIQSLSEIDRQIRMLRQELGLELVPQTKRKLTKRKRTRSKSHLQRKRSTDSWACPSCTLVNSSNVDRCNACESEQPSHLKIPCKEDPIGSWQCQACTLINGPETNRCTVCECRRPKF